MRNFLGILAVAVALCITSWAQAQDQAPPANQAPATQSSATTPATATTQTPPSVQPPAASTTSSQETTTIPIARKPGPQFPRLELFGGYSFAQAGFFNTGHWAQLNGWNASFGINLTNHVGFVVEGTEYFGNSKIPTAVPEPFPNCEVNCPPGTTFNADTREYNFLFGLQFPFHRRERWTPFGEVMFGHDGVRGQAFYNNVQNTVVSSGLAAIAGAGADYKINERFALRFKADYLATHTSFASLGHKTQDNLRLSVGVVIRSVRKKKRVLDEEPTE
ncbi:MAG TPA: outer membrane beta-barrel protein [Terriglobales bacterium]|nr:outer membrane beta-barrel protein [Terriglobales bacterium]